MNELTPEQNELERRLRNRVRGSLVLMTVLSLVAIAAATVVAWTMARQRDRLQRQTTELRALAGELKAQNEELARANQKLKEQFEALVAVTRANEKAVVRAVPEGDRNPVIREVKEFIRSNPAVNADSAEKPLPPDVKPGREETDVRLERARRLAGQGDKDGARREVEAALEKDPSLLRRVSADKVLKPFAPKTERPVR